MSRSRKVALSAEHQAKLPGYDDVLSGVAILLEQARHSSARAVNAFMTATYWEIGRRIVEYEQRGKERAGYGAFLLKRLSCDLTERFGRGFSLTNLKQFKGFYLAYRSETIGQTLSDLSREGEGRRGQTLSDLFSECPPTGLHGGLFPLPWSHYVRLLKVEKDEARRFYEAEALRCGWTVPQLNRQVSTLFYERTLASRKKAAMPKQREIARPGEELTPEEELKDPLVLEFLGLKDEYSKSELEEALVRELESFLLELGGDFAFVGRIRRSPTMHWTACQPRCSRPNIERPYQKNRHRPLNWTRPAA
jgi:predicted nuclease of restriction endonuclease-like (RecB) superfamily